MKPPESKCIGLEEWRTGGLKDPQPFALCISFGDILRGPGGIFWADCSNYNELQKLHEQIKNNVSVSTFQKFAGLPFAL